MFLVLLLALVGALLGGWIGTTRPFSSTSNVLVNPLVGNPFSPTGTGENLVNLESEAQLVASDQVAARVAQTLHVTVPTRTLLKELTVSVPPNTQVLSITYTDPSQRLATQRAEAFATAFLQVRAARAAQLKKQQSTAIQQEISALQKQGDRLAASRRMFGSAARQAALSQQIQGILARVRGQQQSLDTLSVNADSPGEIVNSATASKPFGSLSPAIVYGVLGFLAFLVLGVALALVRRRSGVLVRHLDDVTSRGVTVLTRVPQLAVTAARLAVLSGQAHGQTSTSIEPAMSQLRAAVLMRRTRPLPMSILMATASDKMLGSVTGAALAESMVRANLQVVLVELGESPDYVGDDDGESTDTSDRPGLVEVLQGVRQLDDVLLQVGDGVRLLPRGADASLLQHLIVSPRMGTVLEELCRSNDVVIVEAGPLRDPSVQTVADLVDAIVVEVSEKQTRADEVAELGQLEDRFTGVVYLSSSKRR